MKTSRRTFLKQIGAALALASVSPAKAAQKFSAEAENKKNKLVILHSSDVHSRIEPLPSNDVNHPNQGGYARRQAYIEKVRAEGYDTLVLESGDMFEGTPYFNFYKGALEITLMNRMGIDAVTIGNHEFDLGMDILSERIAQANFPFVCANYEFTHERTRELVKPYLVFERCGRRIGVFGIGIKLNGLVNDDKHSNTIYHEPVQCAQRIANTLREQEQCDLVIALTHIGFNYKGKRMDDLTLAAQTTGIDMILGGHSHTFMDEPAWVTNPDGKQVMVNHDGHMGVQIGRIEVEFCGSIAHISKENITMA